MEPVVDMTVVICTHNRAPYLKQCLDSIYNQVPSSSEFMVLVVDNGSTDHTQDLIKAYAHHPNFTSIKEENLGLSHARNTAGRKVQTRWMAFIDDDAVLPVDYIHILEHILKKTPYACFGGPLLPIFSDEAPSWIKRYFHKKSYFGESAKSLSNDCIAGANMIIDHWALRKINGFNTSLGMTGNKTRYGEDDHIQHELRRHGFKVGYYPNLVIKHHVLSTRENITWHLNSAYHHGTAAQALSHSQHLMPLLGSTLRTLIAGLFKHLPKNLKKMIIDQKYYWQNVYIDSCHPFLFNLGRLAFFIHGKPN